jgi:hypothetical protein
MFPLEEGVWGNRGSPIVRRVRRTSLVRCGWLFGNASASVEWADFVSASKLVYVHGPEASTS